MPNAGNGQVAEDAIRVVMKAAIWAPSAHNRQTWDLIVTGDKGDLDRLSQRRYSGFLPSTPSAMAVEEPLRRKRF